MRFFFLDLTIIITLLLLFPNNLHAQQDKTKGNKEQIGKTEPVQQEFKYDEVEQALNSDLVVIGTVKDMKDTPGKTSEMFHSMVIIHIDYVLRGETSQILELVRELLYF